MEFIQYIFTRKCDRCGVTGSCALHESNNFICRICDPENWETAAEREKDQWMGNGGK